MSNNYIIKLCESNRTGINNNNYNNKLRSYFFLLKIFIIYILFVFRSTPKYPYIISISN